MAQLFFNNARGVLAESISTGNTLIKIKNHKNIPSGLAGGDYFLLTLFRDTTRYGENLEVVKVTAITAGTNDQLNLTVERGYEYPAQIHSAGARLEARLTAQSLRDLLSEAKSFTQQELDTLVGAAPDALDTLSELATALGDDPEFATTVTNELGKKLYKTSYTAADVLAKLLTVDGAGSELDADLLDGKELATLESERTTEIGQAVTDHEAAYGPHDQYVRKDVEAIKKTSTLDLDFSSGDYAVDGGEKVRTTNAKELLTVERATPKWVQGPNGKLREVPPDTVAREWKDGVPQGVLIEESRTNITIQSGFVGGWSTQATDVEILQMRSFDGHVKDVRKYVPTTIDTNHFIYQGYWEVSPDTTYTHSLWLPQASDLGVRFIYRSAGTAPPHSNLNPAVVESRNGWVRRAYTFTTASDCFDLQVRLYIYQGNSISYAGDGTTGVIFDGHQLEAGSTPSSYIPTTDSFVTRAADNVSRTLGSEFNASEGTIFVEYRHPGTGAFKNAMSLNEGGPESYNPRLMVGNDDDKIRLDGAGFLSPANTDVQDGFAQGDRVKAAISYSKDSGTATMVVNGGTPVSAAIDNLDAVFDTAVLGQQRTSLLNRLDQPILDSGYYPRALTAAELVELTS